MLAAVVPAAPERPHMKGSAFSARFEFMKKRFPDRYHAYLERLCPETRALAEGAILKSAWYPFDAFVDLNVTADAMFGHGDFALAREMGAYAAAANLPTVYKIFYRLGSVHFILGKSATLWSIHHDTGRAASFFVSETEAEYHVYDFAKPHPALCRSLEGFIIKSLELTGAREIHVREVECRNSGGARCRLTGSWKDR
jgi:predicted hydrocarbon binding protein